ncbi:MAG TPA: hypothetical protein VGN34_13515, partial [Ktedonobacteraceae bacterium]
MRPGKETKLFWTYWWGKPLLTHLRHPSTLSLFPEQNSPKDMMVHGENANALVSHSLARCLAST